MNKQSQSNVKIDFYKSILFLLVCFYIQTPSLKAQNIGWDFSNFIQGDIIDIVSLYPAGCAFLTSENEIGYYDPNANVYRLVSDGTAEVKIFDENFNYREGQINLFSYNLKGLSAGGEFCGGSGRGFYVLTEEGLPFYVSVEFPGTIVSLPLYESADGSSKPLVSLNTMTKPGDNMDCIWGAGNDFVFDGLSYRMYATIGLDYSDEFRRVVRVSDVPNATNDLSFDGSHLSGRNCFFAWDNTNRKILMLDLSQSGFSGFELISYDDLPIDISNISWMNTIKDMRYFDDELYRRSNSFIFIKTDEGKLFEYWFQSGTGGFSEYSLLNHGSVGSGWWAIWSDISSDIGVNSIPNLESFIQTSITSFEKDIIFPLTESNELLKYDIVSGEFCYIPMRNYMLSLGLDDEDISGGVVGFNRRNGDLPYFYTANQIFSIGNEELFNRYCNELSSSGPEIQKDLHISFYRVSPNSVKLSLKNEGVAFDYIQIYRMDGQQVMEITGDRLFSNPILEIPMNNMYFAVGMKNGHLISSQKFF